MLCIICILIFLVKIIKKINSTHEKFHFENSNNNIDKKIVLITGSTSGIGKTLIDSFDASEYKVIVHGRDKNKLNLISKQFKYVDVICYDLSVTKNIYNLVNEIKSKYKKIDLLINNFYDGNNKEDLNYQLNTNLANNILLSKKISEITSSEGMIINVSSGASDIINSGESSFTDIYSLIKSGIEKFTKILADELYIKKIAVTCLKIDDTYETNLTNDLKFLDNTYKKDPKEIIKCIKILQKLKWNNVSGRIIYSSSLLTNEFEGLLGNNSFGYSESNQPNYIHDILIKTKTNNKILGENCTEMSQKIPLLIKNKNWDFSKYATEEGKLKTILSIKYNVNVENICFHNGTLNFFEKIIMLFLNEYENIITTLNSWNMIDLISENQNKFIKRVNYKILNNYIQPNFDLILNNIDTNTRLIYLISPINKKEFELFLKNVPKNIPIIIDFCYNEFYPELVSSKTIINMGDYLNYNVIAINTFSKFYSLPGINLSFSIANKEINKLIQNKFYYPISNLYEEIAIISIQDVERNNATINFYKNEVERISKILKKNNITHYFSYQNMYFAKLKYSEDEINLKFKDNFINLEIDSQNGFIFIPILNREMNNRILSIIL